MNRTSRWIVAVAIGVMKASLCSADDPPAWPMFRGGPERSGYQAQETILQAPPTLKWAALQGQPGVADTNVIIEASPVIVPPNVYVATLWDTQLPSGYHSSLICFDLYTGAVRWTTALGDEGIWSTPAVANGTVFVAAWDGRVYAVNAATGAIRWSQVVAPNSQRALRASPIVVNGRVYVGTFEGWPTMSGTLYALDAATGAVLSQRALSGGLYSSPILAAPNRLVIVVSLSDNNSTMECYDISGATLQSPLWQRTLAGDSWSTPAVAQGTVFHRSGRWRQGLNDATLYVINPQTGADRRLPIALTGSYWSSPAVDNERLVLMTGAVDHALTAFALSNLLSSGTPQPLWTFTVTGGGDLAASPALANGFVYVGTDDTGNPAGVFYALNAATGQEVWHYPPTGAVGSSQASPAIARGTVVFVSYDNPLYGGVFAFSNCHILTAAFGRGDHPVIQALWTAHRQLVGNQWDTPWHQSYMRWYDQVGPKVAAWLSDKPWLKAAIRNIASWGAKLTK